jgi:hypothetical protein
LNSIFGARFYLISSIILLFLFSAPIHCLAEELVNKNELEVEEALSEFDDLEDIEEMPAGKNELEVEEALSEFDDLEDIEEKSAGKNELEVEEALSEFDDLEDIEEKPAGKNESEVEEALSEFDDLEDTEKPLAESVVEEPSWIQLDGFVRLNGNLNHAHDAPQPGQPDFRDLSQLRTTVKLEVPVTLSDDWKALINTQIFYDFSYLAKNRENFSDELLDLYESEAELREFYINGSLTPDLDVKVGRQIAVWGFADFIRVVDVLNPLDNRVPGVVNVEDIRLPTTMARADYYFGDWRFTGIFVPEILFTKEPVFNSDFAPPIPPTKPEMILEDFKDFEYGLELKKTFSGGDIAFYWSEFYDDLAVDSGGTSATLNHSAIDMAGFAINYVYEDWIFKAETAFLEGFQFLNLPAGHTRSRLDTMLGFEYFGFKDTTLTLEIVNRHINNFETGLEKPNDFALENLTQYLFYYTRDFMNDRLHFDALVSPFSGDGSYQGIIQRYSVAYDLYDDLTAQLGWIGYSSGKDYILTEIYQDNDRFYFEAKYSF